MKPIDQSVVLITGASGGIGLACARAFRDAGARVMLTDIDEKARELTSDRVRFVKADLRDERQLKDLIETTVREFGALDVLVNNAAVITPTVPIHDTTVEQFQLLFDVNVRAPFLLVKHAYPHLKASKG